MAMTEKEFEEWLKRNDQLQVIEKGGVPNGTAYQSAPSQAAASCAKQDAPWSEVERRFALGYLQPALERGEYLWYMAQVTVYMKGQTYTFDFVALRPDGGADHFEVKGSYKLGSQDRSSVKVRWAASYLLAEASLHRVYWAQEAANGRWRAREIKLNTQLHPICK